MPPVLSPFLPNSCCIALQCFVVLTAKLNVDGHMYSPRLVALHPFFTKAIPVHRNKMKKCLSRIPLNI